MRALAMKESAALSPHGNSGQHSSGQHSSFLKRPNSTADQVTATHRSLKSELHQLMRHGTLTPEEQERARALKKLKLLAKDKLELLRR